MDRFTDDRDYARMARERAKQSAIAKFDALPDSALLGVRDLASLLDQGVSTVWRKVQKDPSFPNPVKLSKNCTRFFVGDIRRYLAGLERSGLRGRRADGAHMCNGFSASEGA